MWNAKTWIDAQKLLLWNTELWEMGVRNIMITKDSAGGPQEFSVENVMNGLAQRFGNEIHGDILLLSPIVKSLKNQILLSDIKLKGKYGYFKYDSSHYSEDSI
ncbi:3731_t:CDS:2 [Gigaspora margarita]|uniref:3731_t:CDS:1 n=1 Tax=Gigaspora margarita TaxID=4874 RepID=A0ABN7UIC4_GIGMA|nr:3731_t:CDS:2 [Gigaspora margarita]